MAARGEESRRTLGFRERGEGTRLWRASGCVALGSGLTVRGCLCGGHPAQRAERDGRVGPVP